MEAQPDAVAAPTPAAPGRVAGFWVRVFSDVIDAFVLGAFGLLLAIPLRGVFERLGERGVFIGLAVSLAYSGVLQSRIGRGQTLGKRLLKLRVTRLDGSFLSLDRSLVRYVLVSFPVYQTAVAYALVAMLPFLRLEWIVAISAGLSMAVFFGCFLVIPFHPLKRGVHDLMAGSIVTRGGPLDPAFVAARDNPRRDRRIVVGGLVAGALASAACFALLPQARYSVRGPSTIQAAKDQGMSNVTIIDTGVVKLGGHASRSVLVTGFVPKPSDGGAPNWDETAKRLEAALRVDYADAPIDAVNITLRSGYNIGITKSYVQDIRIINWRTGATTKKTDMTFHL